MLEHVPAAVGAALKPLRSGMTKTVIHQPPLSECPTTLILGSAAFMDGAALPARFTADGEGVSPPLCWKDTPPGAVATVLLVEDVDSPTPAPLLHLIAWTQGGDGEVAEGAFGPHGADDRTGHNSFHQRGWLPPDPPPGHGPHRYLFQIFALDALPDFTDHVAHKKDVVASLEGHVLAMGSLIGTYARG